MYMRVHFTNPNLWCIEAGPIKCLSTSLCKCNGGLHFECTHANSYNTLLHQCVCVHIILCAYSILVFSLMFDAKKSFSKFLFKLVERTSN